ncbi:MAG: PHP domain-containing protein [Bacillota bacterium]|nr:PHP domain-containing protein [Bacillota bacterium]
MKCDFHLHSNFSDSSRSVEDIIDLAKAKGLEAISIVDHDTTETYAYIKTLDLDQTLKIIPGLEISAYDYKNMRKVHLLAYNYQEPAVNINRLCQETLAKRNANSEEKLRLLEENSYAIDHDQINRSKNSTQTLYKQHIMAGLTGGDFNSKAYQDLYKSIFKNGGLADFDIEYVDVFKAMEAVLADGGLPVLAHPGELDSFSIVGDLVAKGLKGIEVYHSSHSKEDEQRALNLAQDYGLFITGGSDDHGAYGKKVDLGTVDLDQDQLGPLLKS